MVRLFLLLLYFKHIASTCFVASFCLSLFPEKQQYDMLWILIYSGYQSCLARAEVYSSLLSY